MFLIAAALLAALTAAVIVPALWRDGQSRSFAIGAPALVVALAAGLYAQLGTPNTFDESLMTALQADAMVTRLAAHMKQDPTNARGWLLLARSQALLGRGKEAALAYQQVIALGNADAAVMDEYAELLAGQK